MAAKNPYLRRGRAQKHDGDAKIVTIEDAQTALPAPTLAGDGASIAEWADSQGLMPGEVDILLTAGADATLTGGAVLYQYVGTVWYKVTDLSTSNVVLAAATGRMFRVTGLIVGTRLAVGGTLAAPVAVTAKAVPVIVVSD